MCFARLALSGLLTHASWQLINEPFCGDFYKDPLLLEPGVADRKNLQPFYDVRSERERVLRCSVLP